MWSVRIPFDSTGTSNNGRPAEQYANWKFEAEEHEKRLATAQADARQQFRTDAAFFESYLAGVLAETEWPRETIVAFEVKPELSAVLLDVDLAEIEDFPDKIYGHCCK